MSDLSGNSLFVLVQVLDGKMNALQLQIEQADTDDAHLADLEEELLTYSVVAMELHVAYDKALSQSGNLPPYSDLVKKR